MARSATPPASDDRTALNARASEAMQAGDTATAAGLLEAARDLAPTDLVVHMNLAATYRRLGRFEDALAAVEDALRINPREFTALLMRASLLERAGDRSAAAAYGAALTQAPADGEVANPAVARTLAHARDVYTRHQAAMTDTILHRASHATAGFDEGQEGRLRAFIDDLTGRRKRFHQEPAVFYYPGLPAIEFYPRDMFPWLASLEAATPDIHAELSALISGDAPGFTPYVDYEESLPLDQWRTLNKSPDWSAFHLLYNGERVEANSARCPRTLDALSKAPQPRVPGRSPAAMFSVLRPHTHIPPHTGVSNTRLVCHLPLIVPPGCRFRVGNETREWRPGRAWVFDDTIEHEAFNDSDHDRIILIFDVEQPAIAAAEHRAIAEVAQALDQFGGAPIVGVL